MQGRVQRRLAVAAGEHSSQGPLLNDGYCPAVAVVSGTKTFALPSNSRLLGRPFDFVWLDLLSRRTCKRSLP
ncbi:hypothetical protein BQ8794_200034 [Mesorhizobium prunaredense]|uniref:Uncharacterized protein n=1 Tax=Mesorhizobium prunaredense TaxID=1631249 RepID=A0A1R3V585_9HYPH|nr:hypothetical protein BQ8794_200034 [Mesorhizobium prunaredense]